MAMIGVFLSVAVVLLSASDIYAQDKAREFKLGFKVLADQITDIVGRPLEDEHYGPNGDSLQQTTTGLMVWRKADNWTAFTNGHRTWINGPKGIQERGNKEIFDWEGASPVIVLPSVIAPPNIVEQVSDRQLFQKIVSAHLATRIIGRSSRTEYDITTKSEIQRFLNHIAADSAFQKLPGFERRMFNSKDFILLGRLLEWGGGRLAAGWFLQKTGMAVWTGVTAEEFLHAPGMIRLMVVSSDGVYAIVNNVLTTISATEFAEFYY